VPAAWRDRWAAEAERYGQFPLPLRLVDEPNAGLRADGTQEAADRHAVETAALVRELAVPALLRAAGDLGWWHAADDLDAGRPGESRERRMITAADGPHQPGDPGGPNDPGDPDGPRDDAGTPTIIDAVDATAWAAWRLAGRVLAPARSAAAHALVLAALRSPHRVRVSAAVSGDRIVAAAVSASIADGSPRRLLALGVRPALRGRGLGTELLRRHLAMASGSGEAWAASITLAERDPFAPLPRTTRAGMARRLLEGAGFLVERAGGPVGTADPGAIVARRA
jgi:GNAT superfamily N-acetyltransferase